MSYTFNEWQKMTPEQRKEAGSAAAPTLVKVLTGALFLTVIFFLVLLLKTCGGSDKPPLTAEQKHQKQLEAQFSSLTGEHRNLAYVLQKSMNDPDSYEHVKTNYWDMQDSIVLKTTIRGKNGFGAKVVKTYRAVSDMEGNIRNITEE